MRFEHDGGSFVEYDDRWTRGEVNAVFDKKGTDFLELLREKIVSIQLNGVQDITSADDLTEDRLDDVDWIVYQWFVDTPGAAVKEMQRLGEASRRALWGISEATTEET